MSAAKTSALANTLTATAGNREPKPGYTASRRNALKHGVLSELLVLPHEDPDEFEDLLAALVDEHSPQGVTEAHLVEEMAGIVWRKRRVLRADTGTHRHSEGRTVYVQYGFEHLSRYETHLDRKFMRTLAMLLKLKELRGGESAPTNAQ